MPSKIRAYLDCVSPYSYYAFTFLNNQRKALESLNVSIEFVPIFLGGVNTASGNKPPWVLPAKAAYMEIDLVHSNKYFGLPNVKKPSVFPLITLKPQRALVYIRDKFPEPVFLSAFRRLWVALWEEGRDITQEPELARAWSGLFSTEQLEAVFAATGSQEYKQKLIDNTEEAVREGAFGAPWFVVWNERGEATRFFGSDRFHMMFEFLEVPHPRLEALPAAKL